MIKKILSHPEKVVKNLGHKGLLNWMSDEAYIRLLYFAAFKKFPDLENPQTFNEKLQWLKLHDHNQLYTVLVDKYEAKKHVAGIIGEKYIIPTLGVWEKFDDIDFGNFPNQFVLKCTHDSGGVVICTDKSNFNYIKAKKKIEKCLKQNFYYFGREWPYKNIKPRILAEKYMTDDKRNDEFKDDKFFCPGINDYKLHCFNGKVRLILVCSNRFSKEGVKEDFYSEDWKLLELARPEHPNSVNGVPRPEELELMKILSERLTEGFPFARVDFYLINNHIYFGEMTFYPATGIESFIPSDWDLKLGKLIKLEL